MFCKFLNSGFILELQNVGYLAALENFAELGHLCQCLTASQAATLCQDVLALAKKKACNVWQTYKGVTDVFAALLSAPQEVPGS